MVVLDGPGFEHWTMLSEGKYFHNQENYSEYFSEDWKNISEAQKEAGHGGMDYVMLKHFFKALKDGEKEMPIDVYDAVSWMCITALSGESIAKGSMPVEIPDFTRGAYKFRPQKDVVEIPKIKKIRRDFL